MVLFRVLVILGIVVLVRYVGGSSASGTPPSKTALDIYSTSAMREARSTSRTLEERKRDLGK